MDEQQQSYLRKSNIPFTMVANAIIFDNRISSKAKFYYVYLSSKPDGWKFHTNCIIKEIKEGRDAFYSGLKELIQFGYLERTQINEGGKFKHTDFLLKIPPYTENTHTEVAYTENTDYNNKYINKKDKSNNYNINTASGFSQNENPVVNDSFTTQNPTAKESLTVQKQKKEEEVEAIPNCIDISKWEEWKNYKKEKKQKLTKSTAGKQLQNLQKWHLEGQDPNEIIDNSISNGWAGLFPLKQQKPTFNNQYAKPKLSTTSQVAEMFRTQAQYIENNKQTNDDEDEHPF